MKYKIQLNQIYLITEDRLGIPEHSRKIFTWKVLSISRSAYLFCDMVHERDPFWIQKKFFDHSYIIIERLGKNVSLNGLRKDPPSTISTPTISTKIIECPDRMCKSVHEKSAYMLNKEFPVIIGKSFYVFPPMTILTKCEYLKDAPYFTARMEDSFYFFPLEVIEAHPEYFKSVLVKWENTK